MTQRGPSEGDKWEDLVRRLGGTSEQAQARPSSDPHASDPDEQSPLRQPWHPPEGPRDYQLAEEIVEDFHPPVPKPIASGNPRTVLSWIAVIGAITIWLVTALFGWSLPWWLTAVTLIGFGSGVASLFFLLPKSWAHRERFDGDEFGDGAKL